MQSRAREFARGDDTLRVFAVHEFPAFADGDIRRQWLAELRRDFPSAPDALHEERSESERLLETHFDLRSAGANPQRLAGALAVLEGLMALASIFR